VLAIASGKGGTGKTLVATNLSAAAAAAGTRVVLADCDVETPDDHLFLHRLTESCTAVESVIASVDSARCTACGRCRTACAYGAIRVLGDSAVVFDELCHGCGVCLDVCPDAAVSEISRRVGETISGAVSGPGDLVLVTGRLDIGQVASPTVIRATRAAALTHGAELVVVDSPPGVACSAVAATRGVDALLLVTEPTPFGLHDLELSLRLGASLGLTTGVVVNRDTGHQTPVEELCVSFGVPIVGRIPFDRGIAELYADGSLLLGRSKHAEETIAALPDTMRELAAARVVA
jgi:MinD superfamily P-loop ATPase